MRVGIFTDAYIPQIGGVSTASNLIKRQLWKMGHEAYVITGADPKAEEEDCVIRIPSYPFVSAKRLATEFAPLQMKEIRSLGLDICHSQTEFSLGSIARRIAKKEDIPLVHTYHTLYEDWITSQSGEGLISKISIDYVKTKSIKQCSFAKKIIIPTEKTRNVLTGYGIETEMQVLPTGIELDTFRQARVDGMAKVDLRRSLGIPQDAFVLLYLGRISNEKAIDQLLSYMPGLMAAYPKLYFVLVGSGPSLQEYERLAKEFGLADRILFTGQVKLPEVPKYYAMANAFASASQSETQGLTYIEAMAAALPLLAYPDTCLDGVLEHGVNGFGFRTENEFGEAMRLLMENPEKWAEISIKALDTAEMFSAERFMEELLEIYKKVIREY